MINLKSHQILIKKKIFITIYFAISLFNNLLYSEEIGLKEIEGYLNSISSLDSEIIQTDQNGNKISGTIKLKKPSKLRIEYNNKDADHLIVGSSGIIAIIDYNSNSEPLRYPIKSTPLKFLSENNINFFDEELDIKLVKYKDLIKIEIKEKKTNLGFGKIILNFQKNPLKILGWEIPINEINTTKIELNNTIINQEIADDLFYISAEIIKYNAQKNKN